MAGPVGKRRMPTSSFVGPDEWPIRLSVLACLTVIAMLALTAGVAGAGVGASVGDVTGEQLEDPTVVTLLTGHQLVVNEGDSALEVWSADAGVQTTQIGDGTYALPADVAQDHLDRELFNVSRLLERGYHDGTVPLLLDGTEEAPISPDAVDHIEHFDFINTTAVHANLTLAERDTVDLTEVGGIEHIFLDRQAELTLDTSTEVIDAPTVRDSFNVTGEGVTVSVIDSGIDNDHPDFGDRVTYEESFIDGMGTNDPVGHGTHVAGTIAGSGNASEGQYVGVAPEATLVDLVVFDEEGNGPWSATIEAIETSIDLEVDVISMSLGGEPTQENHPVEQAVRQAVDSDITTVVAAGNEGESVGEYGSISMPGNVESVITVGALDHQQNQIWPGSSGGPTFYGFLAKPDVVAPGVSITAAGSEAAGQYPYTDKQGTSMATPHVSGLAALALEANSELTPGEIHSRLTSTADPLADPDIFRQGAGVVNGEGLLDPALGIDTPVVNFALTDRATLLEQSFTVTNHADDAQTLGLDASLMNLNDGNDYSEAVSVQADSDTLEPGASTTVTVTVDTQGLEGINGGVITLEAAGESFRVPVSVTKENLQQAGTFEVAEVNAPDSATPDEPVMIEATIENTGSDDTQPVSLRLAGEEVAAQNVTIDGGASTTVTFEPTAPSEAGTYDFEVVTEADSATGSIKVAAAQFAINRFEVPDEVRADDALVGLVEVTNEGDSEGTRSVTISFGDVQLETQELTLAGGATETISFEHDVPLDPGSYDIVVDVEDDQASQSVTVLAPPNFAIDSVTGPTEPVAGTEATYHVEVTNTGDVTGTQELAFELAGMGDTQQLTLESGGSENVSFTVPLTTEPGSYEVTANTDDDTETLGVEVLQPATFEVQDVSIQEEVVQGETVTAEVVVENVGDVAGTAPVTLSIGDSTDETQLQIEPGQTASTSFSIDATFEPGPYDLTVETPDDSGSASLSVLQPATFEITEVAGPDSVTEGSDATFNITLDNVGDVSGETTVSFEVDELSESQSVSIEAGASETVSVSVTLDIGSGDYTYTAAESTTGDSMTGELTVESPFPWMLVIGGGIGIVIVLAVGYWFYARSRQENPRHIP